MRQSVGNVNTLTRIGHGEKVQSDRFGIALFDDGAKLRTSPERVVRATVFRHIRLRSQLDALHTPFTWVEENVDPLAVDGIDAEVTRHRLGAATTIQHDPRVDAVAAHGGGKHVVEFILADHA